MTCGSILNNKPNIMKLLIDYKSIIILVKDKKQYSDLMYFLGKIEANKLDENDFSFKIHFYYKNDKFYFETKFENEDEFINVYYFNEINL